MDLTLEARQILVRSDQLDVRYADLRTVDDVFLRVGSVNGIGHRKDVVPGLVQRMSRLNWDRSIEAIRSIRPLPACPRFDVVVSLLGKRNYSRYDVEDAAGVALAEKLGGRFVSRSGRRSDEIESVALTVRVFVTGEGATFALRLGAHPQHRKTYKKDAGRGTLHPPLAAVLARLVAPLAEEVVVDPFCGDGTIPIEVAALAPKALVHGSDYDPVRITNAQGNAQRAGVAVRLEQCDAGQLAYGDGTVDVVMANPPWNLAVEAAGSLTRGLGPFWSELSRVLSPNGRLAVIADTGFEVARALRDRGYDVRLVQVVRLAGRLAEIVVGTRPDSSWDLPPGVVEWRAKARRAGLLTETGFDPSAGGR